MPTTCRSGNSSARVSSALAVGRVVEGRDQDRARWRCRSSRSWRAGAGRRSTTRRRHRQRRPRGAVARPRSVMPRSRSQVLAQRLVVGVARVVLDGQRRPSSASTKRARSSTWPWVSSPAMPRPSQRTLRTPRCSARTASSSSRGQPGVARLDVARAGTPRSSAACRAPLTSMRRLRARRAGLPPIATVGFHCRSLSRAASWSGIGVVAPVVRVLRPAVEPPVGERDLRRRRRDARRAGT